MPWGELGLWGSVVLRLVFTTDFRVFYLLLSLYGKSD